MRTNGLETVSGECTDPTRDFKLPSPDAPDEEFLSFFRHIDSCPYHKHLYEELDIAVGAMILEANDAPNEEVDALSLPWLRSHSAWLVSAVLAIMLAIVSIGSLRPHSTPAIEPLVEWEQLEELEEIAQRTGEWYTFYSVGIAYSSYNDSINAVKYLKIALSKLPPDDDLNRSLITQQLIMEEIRL